MDHNFCALTDSIVHSQLWSVFAFLWCINHYRIIIINVTLTYRQLRRLFLLPSNSVSLSCA
jgi:hypothetical protein